MILPLVALLGACCPPPPSTAAATAAPREVSVAATARLNVTPDEATISLTFSATSASMKRSHADSAKAVETFVTAVQTLGVPKESIELASTTDDPNYRWDGTQKITGYTSSTRLAVKTADFEKVADIVDTAVQAGVTAVDVDYHSTSMPEKKKKARDMAIVAAKEKAAQLAEGLGAKLGEVRTISEGTTWGGGGYRAFNNVAQTEGSDGAAEGGPVAPGTTPLELTINATFALE